jgi:hypothetical protein
VLGTGEKWQGAARSEEDFYPVIASPARRGGPIHPKFGWIAALLRSSQWHALVSPENFCGNARRLCLIRILIFVKNPVNTDFNSLSLPAAAGRAL